MKLTTVKIQINDAEKYFSKKTFNWRLEKRLSFSIWKRLLPFGVTKLCQLIFEA